MSRTWRFKERDNFKRGLSLREVIRIQQEKERKRRELFPNYFDHVQARRLDGRQLQRLDPRGP